MDRRKFIKTSAAATCATLLTLPTSGCFLLLLRLLFRAPFGTRLAGAAGLGARAALGTVGRGTTALLSRRVMPRTGQARTTTRLTEDGRHIGTIAMEGGHVSLLRPSGTRLVSSHREGDVVRHRDQFDRQIGISRYEKGDRSVRHYDSSGEYLGRDDFIAALRLARHFDRFDQYIGSTELGANGTDAEIVGGDSIMEMLAPYARELEYDHPEITAAYQRFRSTQQACLNDNRQCEDVRFDFGNMRRKADQYGERPSPHSH